MSGIVKFGMKTFKEFHPTKTDEVLNRMKLEEPIEFMNIENRTKPVWECFGRFYIKEGTDIKRVNPPIIEKKE